MKILVSFVLVLALGSFSGVAMAEPATAGEAEVEVEVEDGIVSGVLEEVNPGNETVTIGSETYEVPDSVADLATFSAGEGVVLAYSYKSGSRQAISLVRMPNI